jgi:phosphoribosylanthranilate isomerase
MSRTAFAPRPDGRVAMKVCCIASRDEAALAAAHGADAIGLVSEMPSGPGPIPEETIIDIAVHAPRGPHRVLLTALTHPRAIAEQVYRCGVDAVQLVDNIGDWNAERLRDFLRDRLIIQVVHVRGDGEIAYAQRAATWWADAILLDSGNPDATVRELGGTGRTHDWSISRAIVESVPVPVFLAGGLHPGNVAEAVAAVRPYGVDVCSRLRTEGRLDTAKLAAFESALRPS